MGRVHQKDIAAIDIKTFSKISDYKSEKTKKFFSRTEMFLFVTTAIFESYPFNFASIFLSIWLFVIISDKL